MSQHGDFVFRAFRGIDEHLQSRPNGGFRLKSSWFRVTGGGVSVDDGAFSTPEETQGRNGTCGVARVSKQKLSELGYAIEPDPQDTAEDLARNPSHRIVPQVTAKDAKRITKSAQIILQLEGYQVVAADD